MGHPITTIPLEQYGFVRAELGLPESVETELDSSWAAFVEDRAKKLATQAHPKPVKPEMRGEIQLFFLDLMGGLCFFLPKKWNWFKRKIDGDIEVREKWFLTVEASYATELVAQRERIATDPEQVLAFLDESAETLWGDRLVEWEEQAGQLMKQIELGQAHLARLLRQDGTVGDSAHKKEVAVRVVDDLVMRHDLICAAQAHVVRARQKLQEVMEVLRSTIEQQREDREFEAWLLGQLRRDPIP